MESKEPLQMSLGFLEDEEDSENNEGEFDPEEQQVDLYDQFKEDTTTENDTDSEYNYGAKPYDFDQLPQEKCEYCGIHDPNYIVKCDVKGCNKWFCNQFQKGMGSHIIVHLVKAKHNQIVLHPESVMVDLKIECFFCKSKEGRNVFRLGIVASADQSLAIFLCREPCLHAFEDDEHEWLIQEWTPIIEDKSLLNGIVAVPTEPMVQQSRKLENKEIVRLENMWKKNPKAGIEDLKEEPKRINPDQKSKYVNIYFKKLGLEEKCPNREKDMKCSYCEDKPTLFCAIFNSDNPQNFFTTQKYINVYRMLIDKEAEYDKETTMKRNTFMSFKDEDNNETVFLAKNLISVKWGWTNSNKRIAYFNIPREDNVKTLIGDEIKLKCVEGPDHIITWEARGYVVRISHSDSENADEIAVELKSAQNSKIFEESWKRFAIEFIWKPTSFNRMKKGLNVFTTDKQSITAYLFYKILGKQEEDYYFGTKIPKNLSVRGLPQLNIYQSDAVKKALVTPLCLIQGPPGTGKTVVSATLVYHLASKTKKQVLVCAPSNIAVDHLAERIERTGLNVVRLCARSRETIDSRVEHLTLHELVKTSKHPICRKLNEMYNQTESYGGLTKDQEEKLMSLKIKAEKAILSKADVICTTCITSFDKRLKDFTFESVLIDEATQACEPECILPMLKGTKHVILVGDHAQLGPVIMCKQTVLAGLNISLFERLIKMGNRPLRLQIQYRMHPALSVFPSDMFYEGSLQNGVSAAERTLDEIMFPWPNPDKPMFFLHTAGKSELSGSGTSYLNRNEAINIEVIVSYMYQCGMSQIGIITPYEAQKSYLLTYFERNSTVEEEYYKAIEVSSVDSFQGREKDFIIVSCVRSNEELGIGFLSDPRRLNVSITRAKYGLIIVGNANVLATNHIWRELLNHYQSQGLLVEGAITNLTRFRLKQKYVKENHTRASAPEGQDLEKHFPSLGRKPR